jgi:hypothetical protein
MESLGSGSMGGSLESGCEGSLGSERDWLLVSGCVCGGSLVASDRKTNLCRVAP